MNSSRCEDEVPLYGLGRVWCQAYLEVLLELVRAWQRGEIPPLLLEGRDWQLLERPPSLSLALLLSGGGSKVA